MKQKLMANFSYVLAAGLGLLNLILMAFTFMQSYAEFRNESEVLGSYTGYKLMDFDLWEGTASSGLGTLISLVMILALLVTLALLVIGALALLKEFDVIQQFPEKIGNIETKTLTEALLIINAGLFMVGTVFMLIFCGANTSSAGSWKSGLRGTFGLYFTMIVNVATYVCLKVLPKQCPKLFENGPVTVYTCTQCGKKAKKTDKFCNACGGSVVESVVVQKEFVCSTCGKKAKKTDKFCNACGGAVIEREVTPTVRVCSQCGAPAKSGANFCNACGGAIVEQSQTENQA